jgi:ankyrin repeat protein
MRSPDQPNNQSTRNASLEDRFTAVLSSFDTEQTQLDCLLNTYIEHVQWLWKAPSNCMTTQIQRHFSNIRLLIYIFEANILQDVVQRLQNPYLQRNQHHWQGTPTDYAKKEAFQLRDELTEIVNRMTTNKQEKTKLPLRNWPAITCAAMSLASSALGVLSIFGVLTLGVIATGATFGVAGIFFLGAGLAIYTKLKKNKQMTLERLAAQRNSQQAKSTHKKKLIQKTLDMASYDFQEKPKHETKNKYLLHRAIEQGKFGFVKPLLDDGADINEKNINGDTPLHVAVKRPDVTEEKLDALINYGADLNAKDAEGNTALHLLAVRLNTKLFKHLIDKGADIACQNNKMETVLHVATTQRVNPNIDKFIPAILKKLTENVIRQKDQKGKTALLLAVKHKNWSATTCLLNSKHFSLEDTDSEGNTLLHLAVKSQFIFNKVLDIILEKKRPDLLIKTNNDGNTPLLAAAAAGKVEAVTLLLTKGANRAAENSQGENFFHLLAKFPQDSEYYNEYCENYVKNVLNLLTEEDNVNATDYEGNTALHLATGANNIIFASALLKREDVNVAAINDQGKMPTSTNRYLKRSLKKRRKTRLLLACIKDGDVANLKKVKTDQEILISPVFEDTCWLHRAVEAGHLNIVKYFIEYQSLKIINIQGHTAIDISIEKEINTEVTKFLLGVQTANHAVLQAAEENDIEKLKKNVPDAQMRFVFGEALCVAARKDATSILRWLLNYGSIQKNDYFLRRSYPKMGQYSSKNSLIRHLETQQYSDLLTLACAEASANNCLDIVKLLVKYNAILPVKQDTWSEEIQHFFDEQEKKSQVLFDGILAKNLPSVIASVNAGAQVASVVRKEVDYQAYGHSLVNPPRHPTLFQLALTTSSVEIVTYFLQHRLGFIPTDLEEKALPSDTPFEMKNLLKDYREQRDQRLAFMLGIGDQGSSLSVLASRPNYDINLVKLCFSYLPFGPIMKEVVVASEENPEKGLPRGGDHQGLHVGHGGCQT